MALKDIIEARREITVRPGQSFSVGAIDATIAVKLIQNRQDQIKNLFDVAAAKGLTEDPDPLKIGMLALDLFPDLTAEIIAWASGEPESVEQARTLPVTAQLEALDAVLELTFEAEGGVKKFGEIVVRLLQRTTGALGEIKAIQ